MHHHFSSQGYCIDDILEKAINNREYRDLDGYKVPIFPDLENGLVLLGHLNQHLTYNLLGLRQIIDWEMYIHKAMNNDLWENEFMPLIIKLDLEKLAINTIQMCIKYCGLPNNLNMDLQLEDCTTDYISIIFETGNFGRKAQDSTENKTDRRIMSTMYNIKREGFFRYFNRIGLNYWELCKKFSFLKLFAWVYGISRTYKKAIKAMVKIGNANKQIKKGREIIALNNRIGVRMKKD